MRKNVNKNETMNNDEKVNENKEGEHMNNMNDNVEDENMNIDEYVNKNKEGEHMNNINDYENVYKKMNKEDKNMNDDEYVSKNETMNNDKNVNENVFRITVCAVRSSIVIHWVDEIDIMEEIGAETCIA